MKNSVLEFIQTLVAIWEEMCLYVRTFREEDWLFRSIISLILLDAVIAIAHALKGNVGWSLFMLGVMVVVGLFNTKYILECVNEQHEIERLRSIVDRHYS